MKQRDSLARSTLDTLPFNIAVLDDEGTILFTNRSWREFNGVGGGAGEMVGVNYFEGVDTDADDHAADALAGLRRVIDGDEEVFTLEYPCHTPDEKQWFLMRAARLADDDQGSVVVAHIDITQRKLAELDAREKRRDLEHLVSRIEGLVGDVMEAVLQASSREQIEETVCDRLVAVDHYTCAWVGRADLAAGTIGPAAAAGDGTPPADATVSADAADPTARALTTGDSQVAAAPAGQRLAAIHDDPLAAIAADQPPSTTAGEIAAFPLVYNDTKYGVLTVYTDESGVLDERELAVLGVLARVASTAINAVESRRILTTDRITELELAVSDDGLFFRDIATSLSCTLQYQGTLSHDDGSVTMLFVVRGAAPDDVLAVADGREDVVETHHVSEREDGNVFEFRVEEPPVVSQLAQRGAETTDITVDSHEVRITLELPASAEARAVVSQLADSYPSTELVARRQRERQGKTRQELLADIEEALTDRQRLALQKAEIGGFFEWPREISGEELADSMDISPSTYHQHLRRAEKKVIEALFDS